MLLSGQVQLLSFSLPLGLIIGYGSFAFASFGFAFGSGSNHFASFYISTYALGLIIDHFASFYISKRNGSDFYSLHFHSLLERRSKSQSLVWEEVPSFIVALAVSL